MPSKNQICEDSRPTSSPKNQQFCNTPLKRKMGHLCKGKPGNDGLYSPRQDDADQPIGGKFRVVETMGELRKITKEEGVVGYSRKNKVELVRLIESTTNRKFTRREVCTKKQLKEMARRRGITNISRLRKDELVEKVIQGLEDVADQIEVLDKREALGGVFGIVIIKPKMQQDVENFIKVSWGTIRSKISEGLAGLKMETIIHVRW